MKPLLSEAMKDRPEQRRAFQRYRVSLSVLVQPVAEEGDGLRKTAMTSAIVTDVSLSGLVFISARSYAPGTLVEVQISLGAHVHLVRAIVKRNHILALPGRRAFQCAVQWVRGETVIRFIPAMAKYLYHRYGPNSSQFIA